MDLQFYDKRNLSILNEEELLILIGGDDGGGIGFGTRPGSNVDKCNKCDKCDKCSIFC